MDKPCLLKQEQNERTISGPALVDLIQAVLEKGVPLRFQAKGFSMTPFIRNGDMITVHPLNERRINKGDVVAFTQHSGKLTLHRVIKKEGEFYRIKGDSLEAHDGLVPESQIIGFVGKIERKGKKVSFGFGPEKYAIAFISHNRILLPFMKLWRLFRSIFEGK